MEKFLLILVAEIEPGAKKYIISYNAPQITQFYTLVSLVIMMRYKCLSTLFIFP